MCVHEVCKTYVWFPGQRHWCRPLRPCTPAWLSLCTGCLVVKAEALLSFAHQELTSTHAHKYTQGTFEGVKEYRECRSNDEFCSLETNPHIGKRQVAYKSEHTQAHTSTSGHTHHISDHAQNLLLFSAGLQGHSEGKTEARPNVEKQ